MISYEGLSDSNPPLFYMESSLWNVAYTDIINYPRITDFPLSSLNISVTGEKRQLSSLTFTGWFIRQPVSYTHLTLPTKRIV